MFHSPIPALFRTAGATVNLNSSLTTGSPLNLTIIHAKHAIFDQSSGISIGLSAIITFNKPSSTAMDLESIYPQDRSPFSIKLPPEMRHQIQVEYLAEYLCVECLRLCLCGRDCNLSLSCRINTRFYLDPIETQHCSTRLSPLSLTCKRMFCEMRLDDKDPRLSSSLAASSFAVLALATRSVETSASPCLRLAAEGKCDWKRIRRLRFLNELDFPTGNE